MRYRLIAITFLCLPFFSFPGAVVFDLERLCIDQVLKLLSTNASCVEVTQYFLDRIRKYNPRINAVITINDLGALRDAENLDNYYRERKKFMGKLHCVPALIKDNILVEGTPMTLGLSYFANFTMSTNAPAVQRLREAGAVILGKANLSPMAMGAPEEPSIAGRVWNPHSLTDSASGSSSGNAAALAARLSVIGIKNF